MDAYEEKNQELVAEDAGLVVLQIIKEPTAASLAYGFENKNNET